MCNKIKNLKAPLVAEKLKTIVSYVGLLHATRRNRKEHIRSLKTISAERGLDGVRHVRLGNRRFNGLESWQHAVVRGLAAFGTVDGQGLVNLVAFLAPSRGGCPFFFTGIVFHRRLERLRTI